MKRVVLYSSAFADWFEGEGAAPLRLEFEAGHLDVIVPRGFLVDTLGVFSARGWSKGGLASAGNELTRIGFRVMDAPPSELVEWLTRGLPASVASYAAPASWLDASIAVTDPDLRRAVKTLPQAV